jgi:hypothetical protein
VTLRRIFEAATELVDARYGALGVLGPDGSLTAFVDVGVDEDAAARVGDLPEGRASSVSRPPRRRLCRPRTCGNTPPRSLRRADRSPFDGTLAALISSFADEPALALDLAAQQPLHT